MIGRLLDRWADAMKRDPLATGMRTALILGAVTGFILGIALANVYQEDGWLGVAKGVGIGLGGLVLVNVLCRATREDRS